MAIARKVTPSFPGTAQEVGGDDWNALVDLIHGQPDVDNVDLNSSTIFHSGKLFFTNPLGNYALRILIPALTANRQLLFPDISLADDELVARLAPAIIKAKTINVNENIIAHSTTNVAGDLLKGDGTQMLRFPKGAASQILRTNAAGTDLEWFTLSLGTWNPNAAEALTQKIISVDLNTINHSSLNVQGDLLVNTGSKYDRFGRGTSLQQLRVNTAGTGLEWFSPAGTSFTPTSTDELQNKTIKTNLNTLSHGVTNLAGDLLVNTGTKYDRFAKGTALQQLRMKSDGSTTEWFTPSATGAVMVLPDGTTTTKYKIGRFWGGSVDGDGLFAGITKNGTVSFEQGTNEMYTVFTSPATDATLGGIQSPGLITRRDYNPSLTIRFKGNSSSQKLFMGFCSTTPQPVNTSTPLNSKSGAAFGYDNGDANFQAYWNNGASGEQILNTGTPKDLAVHTLVITLDNTLAKVLMTLDGGAIVDSTTAPPAATTGLFFFCSMEAAGANLSPLAINYAYILQDK